MKKKKKKKMKKEKNPLGTRDDFKREGMLRTFPT